jgi:hypothetical protein
MSNEAMTGAELYHSILAARGGPDAMSAEEIRIAHALTSQLSRLPSEIDVAVVDRLLALLPAPVRRGAEVTNILVEYCSGFSETLRSMLSGAGKEGLASEIDSKLAERISELEAQVMGSDRAITELRQQNERLSANASQGQRPPPVRLVHSDGRPVDREALNLVRPGQDRGIWP